MPFYSLPSGSGSGGAPTLSGSGAPSNAIGNNGQLYIDTVSKTLYGPKTAGEWGTGIPLTGATWAEVTEKPSSFPPSAHTHDISDVTALQTALDGKAATTHTHAIADVTSLQTALNGKAATSHSHAISDVSGLQSTLDGKQAAGSYSAATHTHAIADVTGLQTALDGKAGTSHTHTISNVTGLQTALDGKQAAGSYAAAVHTHSIADVSGLQTSLNGKAAASHTHSISDVTGLQTAMDGKQVAGSYAAASHTHSITEVSGLQTALNGKQASGDYAAATHTHIIADVTGLQTALDGKQPAGSYASASHTHSIADVTGLQTALDGKAGTSHTHTISNVTGLQTALDGKQAAGSYATLVDGKIPLAQIPSGISSGSSIATTDDLSEGSSHLYFTSSRALAAIPTATDSVAGLVKVGSGLQISGGILSASNSGGGGGLSWSSVPNSATASGTAGQLAYDDGGYLYVCTAANTWKRVALSSWATPVISISAQPSNQTASSGSATFSLTASVTLGGSLTYQWQKSTDGGNTWANVSGATSSSLALTSQTTANNNNQYRVMVTSTGATSVTSNAATLTVAASFAQTAVILTSGQTYQVPSGAQTMKIWAIGAGGASGAPGGAAGGCVYRTFNVTGGWSVTCAVGARPAGSTGVGGDTTVTFLGFTLRAYGGSYNTGGGYSGGDGGATGGASVGDVGSENVTGGAVGGNAASIASCGRRPATDVSGLLAAVALANGKTTEDCGDIGAFGSGAAYHKFSASKQAGYGGGSGYYQAQSGGQRSWAGDGAVVLLFS
jgi:hypothetical protein